MSTVVAPAPYSQVLLRLVWKELRQYRGLIGTLLATALLLHVCGLVLNWGTASQLMVASVFPVLAGLAIAGTSFAGEHDNATFLCLRLLPISRRQILQAKLLVAGSAAAFLFVVLWGGTFLFSPAAILGQNAFLVGTEAAEWIGSAAAILLEALVYGALLSLTERNALVAVVKSIAVLFLVRLAAAAICYAGLFAWLSMTGGPQAEFPIAAWEVGTYVVRAIFLVLAIVGMRWAAERWYAGETLPWWPSLIGEPADAPPRAWVNAPVGPGIWRRLGWLQLRYFGWVAVGVVAASMFCCLWEWQWAAAPSARDTLPIPRPEVSLWVVTAACTMLGGLTFRAASARKAFLVALGVSPWRVWGSQLLPPLFSLVLLTIAFAVIFRDGIAAAAGNPHLLGEMVSVFWCVFAWGQLCSQQSRSPLAALAWSGFAAACVVFVLGFLAFARPEYSSLVWWGFSLLVLGGYPLLESFLRAPAWLSDWKRHSGRWIAVRVAVIGLCAIALVWRFETEIPYYPNQQIAIAQNHGVPPDISRWDEINAAATRLQQRAGAARVGVMAGPPDANLNEGNWRRKIEAAWYEASRDDLERVLDLPFENFGAQTLQRYGDTSLPWPDAATIFHRHRVIHSFLNIALEQELTAGNVELAERIIRKNFFQTSLVSLAQWAWLDNNDPQRIRRMVRFIQSELDPAQAYVADRSGLVELPLPTQLDILSFKQRYSQEPLMGLAELLVVPRENRVRRKQALALASNVSVLRNELEQGVAYFQTMVAAVGNRDWESLYVTPGMMRSYVYFVALQRFAAVQLAAIAWLREHPAEELKSLEALVPDYLPAIPLDPYTAEPIIFEHSCDLPLQPKSIWTEATVPSTDLFLFSPADTGIRVLQQMLWKFQRKKLDAGSKPELAWSYSGPLFEFRLLNPSEGIRNRSVMAGPESGLVAPLRINEPSAVRAEAIKSSPKKEIP